MRHPVEAYGALWRLAAPCGTLAAPYGGLRRPAVPLRRPMEACATSRSLTQPHKRGLIGLYNTTGFITSCIEQAVIRIFTPSNVCAMTNLVKAIDLRCPPIMQIHCLSRSPVKFLVSSLITQMVFLLNLIKLVIKRYRR